MRLSILTLIAVLSLPCVAHAQWYQGPSGGTGGHDFDDWGESGQRRDMSRLYVIYDDNSIRCLKIDYKSLTPGLEHGNCSRDPFDESTHSALLILEPDEYVLGIAGTFGDHISSLRIYTSKGQTARWGNEVGKWNFGYTAPSGQTVVAFIGRSGDKLDALGVMYAPCTAQQTCK